jgi:hypothetical protein
VDKTAPSDAALARCVGTPAPAFDLFGFFCGQIEQAADAKFALEQFEARDAWIAQATEHLTALYRLAEEFAPKQLAELVAYLSWRDVYMVRHEDDAYTLHPTVQ